MDDSIDAHVHDPPGDLRCHLPQEQVSEQPTFSGDNLVNDLQKLGGLAPAIRPRPKSSHDIRSTLAPSPLFVEPFKRSKDDINVAPSPITPKRPFALPISLSLQMPPRDISSTSTASLTKRIPLSPKLDSSSSYASPSVLPRRSRGLDFSRACTNLHHSTLAEQSSPDSSPIIGSRGVTIPCRKGLFPSLSTANFPESPGSSSNSMWSHIQHTDKTVMSSSIGSINMMEFDSGSSSSDDDQIMEHLEDEEAIHITPCTPRIGNGQLSSFGLPAISSPGADYAGSRSPAASKLMSFQRARFKKGRSRKSSSSASGQSSMHSPASGSPPLLKSIESSLSVGHFPRESSSASLRSRRESLSLGTKDLQLTDGEESYEDALLRNSSNDDLGKSTSSTPAVDERRNVIRRAVTRRTNMLPQTRVFARIKAALHEESTPVDTEVRKEAEVIKQVRGSDVNSGICRLASQPPTAGSSPNLIATAPTQPDALEHDSEDLTINGEAFVSRRSSSSTFTSQAIKNSGGLGFWHTFEERTMTPPISIPRGSSSGISDTSMDTPLSSIQSSTPQPEGLRSHQFLGSRSSTPQPPTGLMDTARKGNKRMRDDDFDPSFFKRRAVSPGMSLQNSPILPQSPLQREGGWWGIQVKSARETSSVQVRGERIGSGGSANGTNTSTGPSKRVGMQGMNDTNDGLMNMSIE